MLESVFLLFDFVLIEQVLVNLLDNAQKFSAPASPIQINVHMQNELLFVSVINQGNKVPDVEMERIFDKFYRASDAQRTIGLGLELSIAKGIVEAHGGTVFAKPYGDGMEIGFGLPAHPEEQTV